MWYYLIFMNFSVFGDGFLLFVLSACAQGSPIEGESLYGLSIQFDDTAVGAYAKMF